MDILVFDGTCGLCTAAAAWVKRKDTARRMQVIPYQLAPLEALSPGLTPELCSRSVYLVGANGQCFKEARAVFETLKRLPGVWHVLGVLLANRPGELIGTPFYRLVARWRTRISICLRLTACAVRPPVVSEAVEQR